MAVKSAHRVNQQKVSELLSLDQDTLKCWFKSSVKQKDDFVVIHFICLFCPSKPETFHNMAKLNSTHVDWAGGK